jgi:hypothetical protein
MIDVLAVGLIAALAIATTLLIAACRHLEVRK